jgi:hypothetical protein
MPQDSEICDHIDWYTLDNDKPPICDLGHDYFSTCMRCNDCPDYKKSVVYSWEEFKDKVHAQEDE